MEFFHCFYIDLKFKPVSQKVGSVDSGIRLPWFTLGLPQFLLCRRGMVDRIYLPGLCKNCISKYM